MQAVQQAEQEFTVISKKSNAAKRRRKYSLQANSLPGAECMLFKLTFLVVPLKLDEHEMHESQDSAALDTTSADTPEFAASASPVATPPINPPPNPNDCRPVRTIPSKVGFLLVVVAYPSECSKAQTTSRAALDVPTSS
jgi:hypothetical protein